MNAMGLEKTNGTSLKDLCRKSFLNRFEDPAHREKAGRLFDANVEAYGGFTPEDGDRLASLILSGAPLNLPEAEAKTTEELRESANRMVGEALEELSTGLSGAGGEGRNAFGEGHSLFPSGPDDGLQPYEDFRPAENSRRLPPVPSRTDGAGCLDLDDDCNYFNW